MKLLFIIGTRPEAIKLSPIIIEARKRGIHSEILCTGQHTKMVREVLGTFDLTSDHHIKSLSKGDNLGVMTSKIVLIIDEIFKSLEKNMPTIVMVQGDTVSAFIGALVSFYHNTKVAHIEAGLRSNSKNSPFPEEMMRRLISKIADYHFCPTSRSINNLISEGTDKANCFLVGNTGIDALFTLVKNLPEWDNQDIKHIFTEKEKVILMTFHRRENWQIAEDIFVAIKNAVDKYENVHVIFPVHPNPFLVKLADKVFQGHKNITLTHPMVYGDFVNAMVRSYFIVTDSGGIQEEAPYIKKPVIVVRRETERMEGVDENVALLVGVNPMELQHKIKQLLHDKPFYDSFCNAESLKIYGDGRSSEKIMDILMKDV